MKKIALLMIFAGLIHHLSATQLSTGTVTFFEEPQYQYQVKIDIDTDVNLVTIIMKGPSARWFGLAFNAIQMGDQPYAIIANSTTGNGIAMERQLGDHNSGSLLSNTLTVVSDNTVSGTRVLTLTRPITASIYNFSTTASTVNVLWAEGMSRTFGYHLYRSQSTLTFYTDCASITGTVPRGNCGPGTLLLGATASTGTLKWYANYVGGASLSTGANFTTPSISATTIYYVSVTNNGCVSDRTPVTASIFSVPVVTINIASDTVCTGTSVSFTANGASSYKWSNGVSNPVLSFIAKYPVTYFVTGYDANGCWNTATQSIEVTKLSSDINNDGITSASDLGLLLLQFGKSCK